jgi:hypothetical protein
VHHETRQRQPSQNSHSSKPRNRTQLTVFLPPYINLILKSVNRILIPPIRTRKPQFMRDQVVEQVVLHDGHGGVRVERVVLAARRYVAERVDAGARFVCPTGRRVGFHVAFFVAQSGRRELRVGRDARARDVSVDYEGCVVVELDFDLACEVEVFFGGGDALVVADVDAQEGEFALGFFALL